MTKIHLDFSPKGGPADAAGTWSAGAAGAESIAFPDGNTWQLLAAPTAAVKSNDGLDDHAGIFLDPKHSAVGVSWSGVRAIAEFPPHVLQMVGSDDGSSFWHLSGSCTGPAMTQIHFDFSAKGGPKDLVGEWKSAPTRAIVWPDSNAWAKPAGGGAAGLAAAREPRGGSMTSAAVVLVFGLGGFLLHRRWAAGRGLGGPARFA